MTIQQGAENVLVKQATDDNTTGVENMRFACPIAKAKIQNHHHKHQGLDPLMRSVRVTTALANVSLVFQLFSFFVVCSDMISKGFCLVAFFASVKASSVCIQNRCRCRYRYRTDADTEQMQIQIQNHTYNISYHCFSTVTMVSRERLNVTLYV
jgi:hypothetical protein